MVYQHVGAGGDNVFAWQRDAQKGALAPSELGVGGSARTGYQGPADITKSINPIGMVSRFLADEITQSMKLDYGEDQSRTEALLEQGALNRQRTPVEAEVEEAKTLVEQGTEEQKDVQPQVQQSLQDPATTIATERVTGGNPPPEKPTMRQIAAVEQDQRSRQVLFDQTKIPKWHESDAFSTALMSFGLNLLAGNDLATSFAAGSQVFDKSYGKEKREMWANDLRAAGYDDAEIMAYIETGDNKLLTDPMEKEYKRQQFQLGQAQLEKAIYESSPEYQDYLRQKERWDMGQRQQASDLAERQFQATEIQRGISNSFERERIDLQKMKASGDPKFDSALQKAENFYVRGRRGLTAYQELEDKYKPGYDNRNWFTNALNAGIIDLTFSGNAKAEYAARTMNKEAAELITAEREFLAPLLRLDSGAAVNQTEWKTTGEIYFPRPGDTPERRAQKAQSREVAVLSMNPNASGEMREAVRMYTNGQLKGLRVLGTDVYATADGDKWYKIQQ